MTPHLRFYLPWLRRRFTNWAILSQSCIFLCHKALLKSSITGLTPKYQTTVGFHSCCCFAELCCICATAVLCVRRNNRQTPHVLPVNVKHSTKQKCQGVAQQGHMGDAMCANNRWDAETGLLNLLARVGCSCAGFYWKRLLREIFSSVIIWQMFKIINKQMIVGSNLTNIQTSSLCVSSKINMALMRDKI